jgi:REP-associated tyrosine transposase
VPGGIHHAVAKGNAGSSIVRSNHDRDELIKRLGKTIERHRWSCLAYCLLDTHLHLILGTPLPNLGQGMKSLLGPYAQDFNRRYEREGHLFRGRFYSRRIVTQNHLISAIVYVALNPVRAGVVEKAELWPWSSYGATIGRMPVPRFLDANATLEIVHPHPRAAQLALELGVRDARARDVAQRVAAPEPSSTDLTPDLTAEVRAPAGT